MQGFVGLGFRVPGFFVWGLVFRVLGLVGLGKLGFGS